jgi:hypothetical protein
MDRPAVMRQDPRQRCTYLRANSPVAGNQVDDGRTGLDRKELSPWCLVDRERDMR